MKKLIGLIACIMLLGLSSVFAQSKEVTGTITDMSGLGMPGVSVSIKGTTEGTNTDIDGKWGLTVSPKDIIIVSFVGMKTQEITVGDKTVMNVLLEEDRVAVEEVMVVAYGVAKKESFTGSATSVKKDDLLKISGNVGQKLQGKVAGVQVVGGDVRIRGFGSFSASSAPLYVVDGIAGAPKPEDENIENITVLKDAASTALYGSRGANGVIIITSKKGKKGAKPVFEFKYQRSIDKLITPEWDLMGASDYYKHQFNANNNFTVDNYGKEEGYSLGNTYYFLDDNMKNNNPFNMDQPYEYKVVPGQFDQNGEPYQAAVLKKNARLLYDSKWRDALLNDAIKDEVFFSITGGSEKSYYSWAAKAYQYDGFTSSKDATGITNQFNYAVNLTDNIKVSLNSRMAYTEGRGGSMSGASENNLLHVANVISPAAPIYGGSKIDADKNGVYESYQIDRNKKGSREYAWGNPNYQNYNPVGLMNMDWKKNYSFNMFLAPQLDVKILKNLDWKVQASAEIATSKKSTWQNPLRGSGETETGLSTKDVSHSRDYFVHTSLNYKFDLGEDHHFRVLAGYEARKYNDEGFWGRKAEYPLGDASSELTSGLKPKKVESNTTDMRTLSYISNVTYNYVGKYYLSTSFRRDGSTRFGADNRWGNFWSLGGSWRISKEDFFEVEDVNNLKLRASYGVTGTDAIGNYKYGNYYSLGSVYAGSSALSHTNLPNAELGWEQADSYSVGIDFDLFAQSRLTGTFEYFYKKTDGLLYNVPIPTTTGFPSVLMNIGEMKNAGFEMELTGRILTDDLTWTMSGTLTYIKNEILSLPVKEVLKGTKRWVEGGSMYDYYIQEWAGVDKNNGDALWYVDSSKTGFDASKYTKAKNGRYVTNTYSEADKFTLGHSTPDFFGSINNEFAYKGFDLSISLLGAWGHEIYDGKYAMHMHDGAGKATNYAVDALDAWTHKGQETNVPRVVWSNTTKSNSKSSRWLVDGDFIKIKNITLGYTIPEYISKKAKLKYARLFTTVDNLASLSAYKSGDPEISLSGVSSGSSFSTSTTIRFGVNIKF